MIKLLNRDKFIYDLDRAGLLELDIENIYPTKENTQEFMVVLSRKKQNSLNYKNYVRMLNDLSPANKEARYQKKVDNLSYKINDLTEQVNQLSTELSNIYKSKKWIYANKLATATRKIRKVNGR